MEQLFWQNNRKRNCLIDGVSSESLTKGETFVSHSRIKLPCFRKDYNYKYHLKKEIKISILRGDKK